MGYAKTIIVGNLGRDPELRRTQNGRAVCNFSVAVNRTWNDSNGERQEAVTWYRVSVWGKQGENCNQYLSKGRQVLVEGRLREPEPYEGRDGEWRASLDLTASNVQFLSGGESGERQQSSRGVQDVSVGDEVEDDEPIPF